MWKSTPETALHLESIILQPVIHISGSLQNNLLVEGGIKTESVYQYIKDSTMLSRFLEEVIRQEYGRLESLLILKDQELVLEEYYYGYDRDQTHNIQSCTKSIVSLLAGHAINENGLPDVNQPISSFFPKMDLSITEDKNKITLHHVLTMTAGFQSDDSHFSFEQDKLAKYILHLPLESGAGEQFRYNSECSYLLGSIIYAKTGQQVDNYAKEKLLDPLGISNYQWEEDNGMINRSSQKNGLVNPQSRMSEKAISLTTATSGGTAQI